MAAAGQPWTDTGRSIVAGATYGKRFDETGRSPLLPNVVAPLASNSYHAEVCRAVLDAKDEHDELPPHPMLNNHDDDAGTVLHWALNQSLREAALAIAASRHFQLSNSRMVVDGSTGLHIAAYKGFSEVVEVLLNRSDFSAVGGLDRDGFTALHGAAFRGHAACAHLLLEDARIAKVAGAAGAFDVPRPPGHWASEAVVEYDMSTALHMAAERGQDEICEAILALAPDTCDANATNRIGATALHIAARAGHAAVVAVLLRHGVVTAVNAHDARGFTALHWAAHFASGDICASLLAREDFTAVSSRDLRGRTAMDIAAAEGHFEVKRLIVARLGPAGESPR